MIEIEQSTTSRGGAMSLPDRVAATRQGILDRLTDPYLTDHDRWVLRQFARFLGGTVPEPDPRVVPPRSTRPLPRRSGWTTVSARPHREDGA